MINTQNELRYDIAWSTLKKLLDDGVISEANSTPPIGHGGAVRPNSRSAIALDLSSLCGNVAC